MITSVKSLLFACLCLVLASAVEHDSHKQLSSLTIPVFMWSGKQLFSAQNAEAMDTVTPTDLEQTLLSLLNTQNTQGKLINTQASSPVEVVVLFAESELRTDQIPQNSAKLMGLKSQMFNSASSLSAPYATLNGRFSFLETTLNHVSDEATQADILIVREGDSTLFSTLGKLSGVNTISAEAFSTFAADSSIFSNGKTDLIVVCFDKTPIEVHDALISQFSNIVSERTSGNFAAFYTGNVPTLSNVQWSFEAEDYSSYSKLVMILGDDASDGGFINNPNLTYPTNAPSGNNYFTNVILESFLVVAILIAMVFTGSCAIFSLQTPDRWEMPKIKRDL